MGARDFRLLVILLLFVSFSSCRQGRGGGEPLVYAEEEEWDAGLIDDTLRLLQHDFRIINSSSDTCRVLRIDRTCGCIRATADRDEILPGDTAVVNMVVELDNSPYIDKEIYVYLSLQKEPVTLYITAIRGLSDQKIQDQFHYPLGENLRALGTMIVPPFLEQGKTCGAFTNIVNAGKEPIEVEWEMENAPQWLTVDVPSHLQPKETGRINVSFDLSEPCKEWGKHEYTLLVGEKGKKRYPLVIPAIVTPDLSASAQGARPQAYLPKTGYVLLDSEKQQTSVVKHFDILNMGGGLLVIADITPSIPTAKCRVEKTELPERQKTRVFVEVPVKDLQRDSVMVIGITTNDRNSPYKEVQVVY